MLLLACATRLARTLPDIREQLTSVHAGWVAACIHLRLPIGSPATPYDIPHCGCRQRNRRPTGPLAPQCSFHIGKRKGSCEPTSALSLNGSHLAFNYGECIGCGNCIEAGEGALVAAAKLVCCGVSKPALARRWDVQSRSEIIAGKPVMGETAKRIRAIVGSALNIREVDAGSCNGCEGEILALSNPYYDLERFGIHFVASPKHADMLLVTVDGYIPGCPPTPAMLLTGILRVLERRR